MRTLFVVAVAVALAASCSPPDYTERHQYGFMHGCESTGQSVAFCECAWEGTRARISRTDYDAYERMPAGEREASATHAVLREVSQQCQARLAPLEPSASPEIAPTN